MARGLGGWGTGDQARGGGRRLARGEQLPVPSRPRLPPARQQRETCTYTYVLIKVVYGENVWEIPAYDGGVV